MENCEYGYFHVVSYSWETRSLLIKYDINLMRFKRSDMRNIRP